MQAYRRALSNSCAHAIFFAGCSPGSSPEKANFFPVISKIFSVIREYFPCLFLSVEMQKTARLAAFLVIPPSKGSGTRIFPVFFPVISPGLEFAPLFKSGG